MSKNAKRIYVVALLIMIFALCIFFMEQSRIRERRKLLDSGELSVEFVDVGEGNCTLIKQGNHTMLIDTGRGTYYKNVKKTLKKNNVDSLDYLCISNLSAKYTESAADVLNNYKVQRVFLPGNIDNGTDYCERLSYSLKKVKNIDYVKIGDTYPLGDAAVKIVGPVNNSKNKKNNSSITIRISYQGKTVLIVSDLDEYNYDKSLRYDQASFEYFNGAITLLPNNGKCDEYAYEYLITDDFFTYTEPEYMIVSNNSVNKKIIKQAKKYKTTVYCTGKTGNISFTISEGKIKNNNK